jgi:hypothetical protein
MWGWKLGKSHDCAESEDFMFPSSYRQSLDMQCFFRLESTRWLEDQVREMGSFLLLGKYLAFPISQQQMYSKMKDRLYIPQ